MVQASSQEAQHAKPEATPPPSDGPASASSGAERPSEIRCEWRGCGAVFDGAELLYRHLCDEHVGRNSKNNLCLSCHWDQCQASYAKRDHITSHLRIHIPMKPFACNVCGKSFKRSQDLKKHGRTHTSPSASDDRHSDDGLAPEPSVPQIVSHGTPPAQVPLYPSLPGLLSPRSREEALAATPSYRSHSSRESASPASSFSPTHDTSPRPFFPTPPDAELAQMRYTGTPGALYPPMPKAMYGMPDDAGYLRTAADHDASARGYVPPRAEPGWNVGVKRPRRMVDDFWDDVRRKKVSPVYDDEMADRLNQLWNPSSAHDPGVLDLFLGDSLNALGAYGAPDATPMAGMPDRAYTAHGAPYDTAYARAPPPPPPQPRAATQNLVDVNTWLLHLGMNMARATPPPLPVPASQAEARMPPLDFAQSLHALGLGHIPGIETLHTDTALGGVSGAPPMRGLGEFVPPQLAVRETGSQPTYRHVEPLTRAPVATPTMRRRAPSFSKEAMDLDEPPARPVYPRLPSDTRASPMDERSGSASPPHHDAHVSRETRERHLGLVLNVLLALNKRQRIDPVSGRVAPMHGDVRSAPRSSLMPPPMWRSESRERALPKPALYDVSARRTSLRVPGKDEPKAPPHAGALPSIAQLLSDVDMN